MELFEHIMGSWYGGLVVMVISSYVIARSCDVFEASTDYIGRNLSDGVKGATLNAIGSSMPELLTTVFFLVFATDENLGRDLAASVGGNTGSAIYNSIIIPMLVIWFVLGMGVLGVRMTKKVVLRDGLFLIGANLLLLVLLSSDRITWMHGLVFTAFYLVYLAYTLLSMKPGGKKRGKNSGGGDDEQQCWYKRYQFRETTGQLGRSWVLLGVSTLVMGIACAGLVEGCKGIADSLDINPLFVALILVAAASSLPDTIISIRDARKGNYDDSLSNVLGSNIFDITISMGLPLLVFLIATDQKIEFLRDGQNLIDIRVILLVITVITTAVFYFPRTLSKRHVALLGVLYVLFILYAIGAAQYVAGSDTLLGNAAGVVKEWLNGGSAGGDPGGLTGFLRRVANAITGGW